MSDFTFRDPLTGIIRFNDANVIHIGYEPSSEDITITAQNDETGTSKTINVNMSGGGGSAVLGQKTITENGTYDADDDGLDGYDQVTVNVPTGGSNRETEILSGSLYGSYTNNEVTSLKEYALAACPALTSVSLTAVTSLGNSAFRGDTALETVNLPELTATGTYCFNGCTSLNNLNLPKLTSLNNNSFEGCTGLTSAKFPAATSLKNTCLRNCGLVTAVFPSATLAEQNCLSLNNLTAVDFPALTQMTGNWGLADNTSLTVVILRNTGGVVSLANSAWFNNTPLATTGTGGDIYVPSSLVSTYENATNWSVLNATFKAIEGSYYETHYADGTVI